MHWWSWLILGFICLAAEILTPGGFYILFFGLGALLVGALTPILPPDQEWIQWLLFSVSSILLLFLIRPKLTRMTTPPVGKDDRDSLVGQAITVQSTLAVNEQGKSQMRGTVWNVRNIGSSSINAGESATVRTVDGLVLEISKD